MIDDMVIFNNLMFAKSIPFLLQAGYRKGGTAQLAWKKMNIFLQKNMLKRSILLFFVFVMLFKVI